MAPGISGKLDPETIPYWQVDAETSQVIPNTYSSTVPLEYILGPADSYDRLRIQTTLKSSPADQSVLLEETQRTRGKVFDHAWTLQQLLSREDPELQQFINDNLFVSDSELKKFSENKNFEGTAAQNLLELRQAIRGLKVLALKRGEGPAWVEAQLRWVCQADPFLSMLLMPVYQASNSNWEDSISRLQNIALEKGYRPFFGPLPPDPLLGRPEFFSLRWVKAPGSTDKVVPQWGVLSEDGFFNTGVETLQRMTAALGLYTLPNDTRHGKFLLYGRLLSGLHHALFENDFKGAEDLLNKIQEMAPSLFLPVDQSYFDLWRSMVMQKKSTASAPEIMPAQNLPLLPNDQQSVRQLECDFPLWPNIRQDLCVAFFDQSGQKGIYDGLDQLGLFQEDGTFQSDTGLVAEKLKLLGIRSIPFGTSYKVLDQYASHFNRAYEIVSAGTLSYPTASLFQVIDDLRTASITARKNGIPTSMDRFRRVVQDALLLFWDSVPQLFTFKIAPEKVTNEADIGMLFTAQMDLLEKEKRALKVAALVLDRDKQEVFNQLFQIGIEVLGSHLHSEDPKASRSAQYTIRLLLPFIDPKDLEGFVEPMQIKAKQCAENGKPNETKNWLTSVDMVLHPLGKRPDRGSFNEIMHLAYSKERAQLIPALEQAALSFYEAILRQNRGNKLQGDGGQQGVDPDQSGVLEVEGAVEELNQLKTLLKSWRDNAKGFGEDAESALETQLKNLKKLQPESYKFLLRAYRSL